MNPLTNTKNQNLLNERELRLGYTGTVSSWHRQYKDSAWIFIGGLNYELTEGDLICVFSQYGEIVNINLVRDKKSGQSKGFAFLCYEDQRSTVLATDNLNGIKLAGRVIRVDHVEQYKVPKDGTLDVGVNERKKSKKRVTAPEDQDAVTVFVREHGCGPEVMKHLKKLQKEQEKLAREKEERQLARHSPTESNYHPRLPMRSIKQSPPDSQEPRREAISDSNMRNRSPSWSPPRKRRTSISPQGPKREPLSSPRRQNSKSALPSRSRGRDAITPPRSRYAKPPSPTQCRPAGNPSPPRIVEADPSPPRRERESTPSPPRRRPHSPPRRRRDSPLSPPRRGRNSPPPPRRKYNSPPPRRKYNSPPPRRRRDSPPPPRRRYNSPSPRQRRDSPPPRRGSTFSPRRRRDITPPERIKQESPFAEPNDRSSHQQNGSSPRSANRSPE